MSCDGVCMRNMHKLLDNIYLFVFRITHTSCSDRLLVDVKEAGKF
jgi:hypothetical protein